MASDIINYGPLGRDVCLLDDWSGGLQRSFVRLAVALFPVPVHLIIVSTIYRYVVDLPFRLLARGLALGLSQLGAPSPSVDSITWALLGAWVVYWVLLFRWLAPKALPGHGKPMKVAVIGAGPSGLVSTKELLEEGCSVDLYEETDRMAGLWNERAATPGTASESKSASTWRTIVTTSSALNSTFSDFPLPSKFAGQEYPFHATRDTMLKYFKDYAEHFGINKCIRYGKKVVKVQPQEGGSKGFVLTTADSATTHYDYVVISTGLNNHPHTPTYPGLENFKGHTLHSADWRGTDAFYKGKRVLVVGAGESGSDVCTDLAPNAASTHLSVRGNTFFLARSTLGYPPDFYESRSLYALPHFVRWMILFFTTFHLRNWRSSPASTLWLILHKPAAFFFNSSRFATLCITKADTMYKALDRGLIKLHPEIKCFLPDNRVEFVDSCVEQFDAVVFATGFSGKKKIQELCPELKLQCVRDLYRGTFLPGVQNMAFVGFCRGQVSGILPMAEMQARWAALVATGKRELPPLPVMTERRDTDRRNNKCHEQCRSGFSYLNFLARHEIGCEPNLMVLALTRPVVFWKVWTSCVSSFTYRITGPHAKPDIALKALSDADVLHPFFLHINLAGMFMSPFLDLPWLRAFRCFCPAIDTWY